MRRVCGDATAPRSRAAEEGSATQGEQQISEIASPVTPYMWLPDLQGEPPPDRCPLCLSPRTENLKFFDDVLGIEDPHGVVAYTCASGYAPDRTDRDTDPWLRLLPYHPVVMPPLRLLALFCYVYRQHLQYIDIAELAPFDRSGQISDWLGEGLPAFTWSVPPFRLSLPSIKEAPPSTCPHCGAQRLGPQPVDHVRPAYREFSSIYSCGAQYSVHAVTDGAPTYAVGEWSCLTPRPFAILTAPRYWTWEKEPWVAEARDFVLAEWTRLALAPGGKG